MDDLLAGHIVKSLERIDAKFDRIDDRLDKYNETLVRNTVTLEDHVLRTNLLENKVLHVETEVTGLKEHVLVVKKVFNLFSFLFSRTALKVLVPLASLALSYSVIPKIYKQTFRKLWVFFGL